MNIATVGRTGFVAMAAIASAVNLSAVMPAVADINVGALACQPTSSRTDSGLLWHQHYVINPPTSSATRWVVCNIPFETRELPDQFQVGAFGLKDEGHAFTSNLCYAHVVDMRNQNAPTTFEGQDFINNPGQDMSFTKIMSTKTPVGYLWSAWVTVTKSQILSTMMEPPPTPVDGFTADTGPEYWTIAVNCQLKPGQALNMISLWPTVAGQ